MFALHPGAAGAAMSQVAAKLSTPRAIVVISPHWDTDVPTVGFAHRPETIAGAQRVVQVRDGQVTEVPRLADSAAA
jgi:hypothetical protein